MTRSTVQYDLTASKREGNIYIAEPFIIYPRSYLHSQLCLGMCVFAMVFGIATDTKFSSRTTYLLILLPQDLLAATRSIRHLGVMNEITLKVMRVILVTSTFAIGVELPRSYVYK